MRVARTHQITLGARIADIITDSMYMLSMCCKLAIITIKLHWLCTLKLDIKVVSHGLNVLCMVFRVC